MAKQRETDPTGSLKYALDVLKRRNGRKAVKEAWCQKPESSERVAPGRRYQRRKRNQLRVLEKIQIVHQVLIQNDNQAAVAKEFRTSQCVVSRLITAAMKKPAFLKELIAERDDAEQQREHLAGIVDEMNQKDVFIDSLAMLSEKLANEHGVKV